QAEDGIRDFHVTGVQTCALPIYRSLRRWCDRQGGGGPAAARSSPPRAILGRRARGESALSDLVDASVTPPTAPRPAGGGRIYPKIGRASCRESAEVAVAGES